MQSIHYYLERRILVALRVGVWFPLLASAGACERAVQPDEADIVNVREVPDSLLHIISRELESEPILGSVLFLGWGPEGQILALDRISQRIEVYDSLRWVRSIGGKGSGPGQFRQVNAMVPLRQGVAVLDNGNRRLSIFDYSGLLLEEHPFDFLRDGVPIRAVENGSGQLLVQLRRLTQLPTDSIWILWPLETKQAVAAIPSGRFVTFPEGGAPVYRVFAPETHWGSGPNGVYVVGSHDYTVRLEADSSSKVLASMALELQRPTTADTSAVRQAFTEQLRGSGVPERQIPFFQRNLQFADSLPLVADISVSADGDIWVQRGGSPASRVRETSFAELRLILASPIWDRWSPNGDHVEAVRFPSRFVPMEFSGDSVLGVYFDDLGRESVAVVPL